MKRIILTLALSSLCGLAFVPVAVAGPGVVLSNTQFSNRPWTSQPEWAKKHRQARSHKNRSEQTAARHRLQATEESGNKASGASIASNEHASTTGDEATEIVPAQMSTGSNAQSVEAVDTSLQSGLQK